MIRNKEYDNLLFKAEGLLGDLLFGYTEQDGFTVEDMSSGKWQASKDQYEDCMYEALDMVGVKQDIRKTLVNYWLERESVK